VQYLPQKTAQHSDLFLTPLSTCMYSGMGCGLCNFY